MPDQFFEIQVLLTEKLYFLELFCGIFMYVLKCIIFVRNNLQFYRQNKKKRVKTFQTKYFMQIMGFKINGFLLLRENALLTANH